MNSGPGPVISRLGEESSGFGAYESNRASFVRFTEVMHPS